jgi:hypothetical protein
VAGAEPQPDPGRLQLAATLLASSVLGAPLVIASAVQAVLFTTSTPAVATPGIVVAPVAIAAFAAAFAAALGAVGLVFSRLAAAHTRSVLRVPLMVLLTQLVLGVLVIALAALTPVVVLT